MSDDAKCYAATPAKTIEQHIMDPNIAKNEAEWWAYHEIEKLRSALIGVTSELETFVSIFKGYQGMTMNNASAAIRAAKAALGESDD
jgi:hypothetical protein